MLSRTRNATASGVYGDVYTVDEFGNETVLGISSQLTWDRECRDWYDKERRPDGSLPPSPCDIFATEWVDPIRMTKNTGTFRFRGHIVSNAGSVPGSVYSSIYTAKGSAARNNENAPLVNELLARTNPFRSEYSVPVALKEMVDVSSLFKIAAKSFTSFVGGNYLNYKFGWVQFVNDLKTLANITTSIERRVKEFDSLGKKGGLRRKVKLNSKGVSSTASNVQVQSAFGVSVRVHYSRHTRVNIHGTVRWRLKEGITLNLDKLSAFNLAVKEVLDLEQLDSTTVWELIPFSWLVDYFVGVSDYLTANDTAGLIEAYDICIVRELLSTLTQTPTAVSTPDLRLSGSGNVRFKRYDRDVVQFPPTFPVPRVSFITMNQALVIAALIAAFKR